MFSVMKDYDRIYIQHIHHRFQMLSIAEASIKLCKEWKTRKGKKNKRVLAREYGGSESNWGRIMYVFF